MVGREAGQAGPDRVQAGPALLELGQLDVHEGGQRGRRRGQGQPGAGPGDQADPEQVVDRGGDHLGLQVEVAGQLVAVEIGVAQHGPVGRLGDVVQAPDLE